MSGDFLDWVSNVFFGLYARANIFSCRPALQRFGAG